MNIYQSTQTVGWFYDRNKEKVLFLKPPYQRKPVWTDNQKEYLIDTILKDYFIPEIYIHRVTEKDGKSIYNVVDGQQRIRSILEFIAGAFELSNEYFTEFSGYKFDDLPEDSKIKIWSYPLFIREITNATEEEVRSVFRRMNKNVVSLNAQELRHATYSGEFIKLMESISEDDYWAENKIVTSREIRRMNDVQYISDLFISMMNGIQNKTKEMDNYYESYEKKFEKKTEWHNRFLSIRCIIDSLLPNIRETRWRNKSDFYTLFMVINENFNNEKEEMIILKKKKISTELQKFSKKISEATLKENKLKKYDKDIMKYVNAVTKSTTDKDRRIERHKIIKAIFNKYI
jgi:hypothetical protein